MGGSGDYRVPGNNISVGHFFEQVLHTLVHFFQLGIHVHESVASAKIGGKTEAESEPVKGFSELEIFDHGAGFENRRENVAVRFRACFGSRDLEEEGDCMVKKSMRSAAADD